MQSKSFKFGDVKIKIVSEIEIIDNDFINKFEIINKHYNYFVYITEEKSKRKIKSGQFWWLKKDNDVIYLSFNMSLFHSISYEQVFLALPIVKNLLYKSNIVLHSSFLIHNDKAILFSGPSGIGKSTQASLWEQYKGAEIINGDRSVLYYDGGKLMAGGFYYCGTSGICKNKSAPVQAIVLLEQGPNNKISKLPPLVTFEKLLSQCSYDINNREEVEIITSLVIDIMSNVNILHLTCRKDESAVVELEKYL